MKHHSIALLMILIVGYCTPACRGQNHAIPPANLLARLDQQDFHIFDVQGFVALGPQIIPTLLSGLESPSPRIQSNSARVLGDFRAASAIPALIRIAKQTNGLVHSEALRALSKIGGPEVATYLLEIIHHEKHDSQLIILKGLSVIGDNRSVPSITKLLLDQNTPWHVRRTAATALRRFRGPRTREALQSAIESDPHWKVYRHARQSLFLLERGVDELQPPWPITIAICKQPEPPEGAKEYLQKWHKEANKPGSPPQATGPPDFASQAEINSAYQELVRIGQGNYGSDLIETLMETYLGNKKIGTTIKDNAKQLIVDIGPSAITALKIGIQRGDRFFQRDCLQCLQAINPEITVELKALTTGAN